MKKAYRLKVSRYPTKDNSVLTDPEKLNQAYEKIKKSWINQSKTVAITNPRFLSENYIKDSNFARVIIPYENSVNRDVILIDLGTQLKIEDLKKLSKRLGLFFDANEIRFE